MRNTACIFAIWIAFPFCHSARNARRGTMFQINEFPWFTGFSLLLFQGMSLQTSRPRGWMALRWHLSKMDRIFVRFRRTSFWRKIKLASPSRFRTKSNRKTFQRPFFGQASRFFWESRTVVLARAGTNQRTKEKEKSSASISGWDQKLEKKACLRKEPTSLFVDTLERENKRDSPNEIQ